jgi:glycosyltransferase involved in cell wall biosynthesis
VIISAIVILRNLEDDINSIYQGLSRSLLEYGQEYEIIFVDDGSTDRTLYNLMVLTDKDKRTKVVKLRSAFGEASAFDAGLSVSQGDIILYFTGRVHINTQDLPKLLKKIHQGYDLVVGLRYPRRDSHLNQWVSKLFNFVTSRITKLKLNDINSGVFATRKQVLESIPFYGNLNNFIPVMAHKQGFKVSEDRIEQLPAKFDQSWYPKAYVRRFLDLISVIFLGTYSKRPLHFLGFLGAIFAFIGAAINIYLFIYRFFGFGGIAGKPMLLLGALLLVIGIQMISIGLLGEMIIFTHAKSIKEYNIEEIIE